METVSNKDIKQWDLIIEPKYKLFDISFTDVWRYRDLLWLLVKRDFISFYKQTILGPLWFFIQPIFTTIIYVFIFGNLAGLPVDGLPKPLFYMTGIVGWNYFSDCLLKTSTVFKDNANIFGKVYFPRLIMPLSIVVSNIVRFGIQFLLLVIFILYWVIYKDFHFLLNIHILLLPLIIVLMAMLGLGAGMMISAMTTKYRDLAFLVAFGVQLLMYVTPVIYPLSTAPEKYKWLIALNPLSPIIEGMRLGLLGKGDLSMQSLLYSIVSSVLILFAGIIVFNKVEKSFVDTV